MDRNTTVQHKGRFEFWWRSAGSDRPLRRKIGIAGIAAKSEIKLTLTVLKTSIGIVCHQKLGSLTNCKITQLFVTRFENNNESGTIKQIKTAIHLKSSVAF
ncbi:hypothetical protein CKA32_003749 [Geitlerinema sp. FC II]|nr:hypothetical protein CKA32_003749 [Geitlerinema sp. FC II]